MPIDPRIPGLATQGFNTPFQNLGGMLEIQQAQQQQEAHALTLQKAKREEQERVAIQRVLQESGGDLSDATLTRITQVAPALGVKFRGDLFDNRKKLADATKAEMESEAKQTEWGLSLLNAAKANPALYPQVRAIAIQGGGDIAKLLQQHPQFDPATIDALLQTGLTAKERLDMDRELLRDMADGKYERVASSLAVVKDDPEELKERYEAYRFQGVPKELLDRIMVDPAAFEMSEAARQTQAGQAEGREIQRAGQAVTLRGQDLSAATQRRGQDLSAATQRAGQAITARGQDMTAAQAAARLKADAATGAGGAKLSAAAIEKIAGADTALGSLDQIDSMYDTYKGIMGPIAGRVAQTRQQLPGADAGFAEFAAEVATLKNAVIKATTGAAMSEPEAQRIMSQIPDITNQPEVFKARMGTTRRNLDTLKRRTIELSGGTVEDAPKPPGGGPEQKPIPGIPGGVAELRNGRWIRVK